MTTTRSATDQVAADDNSVHTVLRSLDPYKFDPGSDDVANAASLNQLLTMLALCFPCLQDPSNQRQLRKQTDMTTAHEHLLEKVIRLTVRGDAVPLLDDIDTGSDMVRSLHERYSVQTLPDLTQRLNGLAFNNYNTSTEFISDFNRIIEAFTLSGNPLTNAQQTIYLLAALQPDRSPEALHAFYTQMLTADPQPPCPEIIRKLRHICTILKYNITYKHDDTAGRAFQVDKVASVAQRLGGNLHGTLFRKIEFPAARRRIFRLRRKKTFGRRAAGAAAPSPAEKAAVAGRRRKGDKVFPPLKRRPRDCSFSATCACGMGLG